MNSEFKFRGGKRTCSINWVSRDTTGFLVIFWKWGPKWYFTHFEGICSQNCKNFFFKSTNLQSLSVCWQCPNTIASNISRKHLNLADAVSFKLLIPQTLAKIWVSIMLLLFKLVVNESLLSHSYQCRNFKLRFLMVNCYWSIFPCNRYIKAPCSTWIMKFKSMGEIIEQFTRLDQTRPDQTTSPHPTPPLPAHKKR